jgi:hypothetical protein
MKTRAPSHAAMLPMLQLPSLDSPTQKNINLECLLAACKELHREFLEDIVHFYYKEVQCMRGEVARSEMISGSDLEAAFITAVRDCRLRFYGPIEVAD